MFWDQVSSKNFYKIIKSPNCSLKMGQHSNHYLPRRYVANDEDVTRNSHGNRLIDFYIATFGFCDQPQKISPAHCETNGVSGIDNRYRENDFCSFREKNKHLSQQCQEIFKQPITSVLNLTKLISLLLSTVRPFYQLESSFDIFNRSKY